MNQKGFSPIVVIFSVILILLSIGYYFYQQQIFKSALSYKPQTLNSQPVISTPSTIIFSTRGSDPQIIGDTKPPSSWKYFIFNIENKKIQPLANNDLYFAEFAQKEKIFENIYHLNSNDYSEDTDVNKLLLLKKNVSQQELWQFDPVTANLVKVGILNKNTCGDHFSSFDSWSSKNSTVIMYTTKPSSIDSSSDFINSVCVYNYQDDKVIFRKTLIDERFAILGFLNLNKIVLYGGNATLGINIIDITSGKEKILPGYEIDSTEESFLQAGIIPLNPTSEPQTYYSLQIYNLLNETLSEPIKFDKLPIINNLNYDHLKPIYFNKATNDILIQHTVYKPYADCWYLIQNFKDKEKLLCADDLYKLYYNPNTYDYDSLRAEFVKWNN